MRMRAWRRGGVAVAVEVERAAVGEREWGAVFACGRSGLCRHARPKKPSTTGSTLVSPLPSSASASFSHSPSFAHPGCDSGVEFGAFMSGVREGNDFDGTPGRFDSTFDSSLGVDVAREVGEGEA
ncbi:hypothetical protein B0H14DRAFT_3178538 [Mycena olivaceomarginata]|nr:hypothetical protein B0H14DRAFT_3178538 [Mycena olivaceomarginata]